MRVTRIEFDGFDWDGGNVRKAQKHGLTLAQIESVFLEDVRVLVDASHSHDETRTIAVGGGGNVRPAFVVFTMRKRFNLRLIRVISARYMHKREIELYEEL